MEIIKIGLTAPESCWRMALVVGPCFASHGGKAEAMLMDTVLPKHPVRKLAEIITMHSHGLSPKLAHTLNKLSW
jgi:hypothetical protein